MAEEGGTGADRAAAACKRSATAQGQGHLEQVQGTRGSREGWGQAAAGGVRMLSETALGCHWCWLVSAFASPGARAGHCRAKRRQHTACPW